MSAYIEHFNAIPEGLANQLNHLSKHPDQSKYLFFDWFCQERSLDRKARKLLPKVRAIESCGRFDPTKTYVVFKNNLRMDGATYDDFRICDLESHDVIFTVVPKSPDDKCTEVYGRDNGFEKPLFSGDWEQAVAWFNSPPKEYQWSVQA